MGRTNKANLRPDHIGPTRMVYERNRKTVFASQEICGICGKPVDKSLKPPHPLAPCVDHIIPIAKGGHPTALENLQLAHWSCNRAKSDKLAPKQIFSQAKEIMDNRQLPQSADWRKD